MPRFLAAKPNADLLRLPWSRPLAEWPDSELVALPRGLSRHVVRFVRVGESILAAKENIEAAALREYRLLTDLTRLDVPCVKPVGVVMGREDADGAPLDTVLLTRHMQFSLPYRALFHTGVRSETVTRLVDAMVVLLARLHLVGFYWGDVSLSNILFRRDAGAFAAHLVDAETGEMHERLSDGQRNHDMQIARTNLFGEFCDLAAGGLLDASLDPLGLVDSIEARYYELWAELTGAEEFSGEEIDRLEGRVRRLNALGFDVAELDISTSAAGDRIRIQPKVVDAGHHSRRLMRLTGLDTEENQARRLLNDLDAYRARAGLWHADEALVAHRWLTEAFEPVVSTIPDELRGKRQAAQFFHEVLDHRWFSSQRESRDVPLTEAAADYVGAVLAWMPDEVHGSAPGAPDAAEVVSAVDEEEPPFDPWESGEQEEPPPPDYLDIAALRDRASKRR